MRAYLVIGIDGLASLLLATAAFAEAPYPPSPVIASVQWDFAHVRKLAPGSDLWPVTWGRDGNLYAAWGDGGGFGGTDRDGRASLGFARIAGSPPDLTTENVWGGKDAAHPAQFGGKVDALLSVSGVLYALGGVWPGAPGLRTWSSPHEHRLLWSADLGATWKTADWAFATAAAPEFCPTVFLNFGRDYEGARDDFVYLYFADAWWTWEKTAAPADSFLARVPRPRIRERSAYEFFAGTAGAPVWTPEFAKRRPVFHDPNRRTLNKVVYDRGLRRYLATAAGAQVGQLGLFDAPEPWGPWTTAAYYDTWGDFGPREALEFELPAKWISADGTRLWCIFSSTGDLDAFNPIEVTLSLRHGVQDRTPISRPGRN